MSDTPRTDARARIECLTETMNYESVDADFSRQLERENTDLRAQLAAKDAEIEAMRPVVESLREILKFSETHYTWRSMQPYCCLSTADMALKEYESKR